MIKDHSEAFKFKNDKTAIEIDVFFISHFYELSINGSSFKITIRSVLPYDGRCWKVLFKVEEHIQSLIIDRDDIENLYLENIVSYIDDFNQSIIIKKVIETKFSDETNEFLNKLQCSFHNQNCLFPNADSTEKIKSCFDCKLFEKPFNT